MGPDPTSDEHKNHISYFIPNPFHPGTLVFLEYILYLPRNLRKIKIEYP